MEQRTMAMLVSPKPVVFQRLQQLQREREKAREKGHPLPPTPEEEEEELHEADDDDDDDDDDDEEGDEEEES
jgi:hypothetical protein